MAYLDPSRFEFQKEDNGVVVTGYFDNGLGARLEYRYSEGTWSVYVMSTEGWPEVKYEGDYTDHEPEVFESIDEAIGYMEQVQAL